MGFHSCAFNTFSLPRIPAGHRHSEDVSSREFEIGSSKNFTCGSRTDESGETILFCKAGDHFRCTVCVFVDKNDDSTVEWLRSEPLSNEDHRTVFLEHLEPQR